VKNNLDNLFQSHPLLETIPAFENRFSQKLSLSVLVPVYNERHLVAASLKRLLALKSELISDMEVIIVDDCSTDGTWEILQKIAPQDSRIQLYRQEKNLGKGAAICKARDYATGQNCIIHDADMEYNPADIPNILKPFVEEGADAVFGSRYISAPYRQALMYRHSLINKGLTSLINWFTDLNLTDVETCYKAINTILFKSIPIRSNDFRFEIELAMKLAKRKARVFEVPIRYLPRTQNEGKKIRPFDGLLAVSAILKFSLVDDIYREDQYGSNILTDLQSARRFNNWMADTLRPYLNNRVLEIGAGVGTLTGKFIPREVYIASDINPHYLSYLRSYSLGKPYLRVLKIDANCGEDFETLKESFDTIIMINVLEHLPDEDSALGFLYNSLVSGGRVVILVPQHPKLYNSLDRVLEHRERYTREHLEKTLVKAGFRVERIFDFNKTAVPTWFFNGNILKRTGFSRFQLKMLEIMMPFIRRLDRLWPWSGLSIIGIGIKD
jgi:glycosyltransferase involved in cell wall biosynthesis